MEGHCLNSDSNQSAASIEALPRSDGTIGTLYDCGAAPIGATLGVVVLQGGWPDVPEESTDVLPPPGRLRAGKSGDGGNPMGSMDSLEIFQPLGSDDPRMAASAFDAALRSVE